MNCEGFRAELWSELDGNAVAARAGHRAACAACRTYERRARALHDALPAAFAAEKPASRIPALLSRIRTERDRPGPAAAWLFAGTLAAFGAFWAAGTYAGWSELLPLIPVPDTAPLLLLPDWGSTAAALAAPIPTDWLAPALGLAAALWLSTYSRILRDERGVGS